MAWLLSAMLALVPCQSANPQTSGDEVHERVLEARATVLTAVARELIEGAKALEKDLRGGRIKVATTLLKPVFKEIQTTKPKTISLLEAAGELAKLLRTCTQELGVEEEKRAIAQGMLAMAAGQGPEKDPRIFQVYFYWAMQRLDDCLEPDVAMPSDLATLFAESTKSLLRLSDESKPRLERDLKQRATKILRSKKGQEFLLTRDVEEAARTMEALLSAKPNMTEVEADLEKMLLGALDSVAGGGTQSGNTVMARVYWLVAKLYQSSSGKDWSGVITSSRRQLHKLEISLASLDPATVMDLSFEGDPATPAERVSGKNVAVDALISRENKKRAFIKLPSLADVHLDDYYLLWTHVPEDDHVYRVSVTWGSKPRVSRALVRFSKKTPDLTLEVPRASPGGCTFLSLGEERGCLLILKPWSKTQYEDNLKFINRVPGFEKPSLFGESKSNGGEPHFLDRAQAEALASELENKERTRRIYFPALDLLPLIEQVIPELGPLGSNVRVFTYPLDQSTDTKYVILGVVPARFRSG